MRYVKVGWSGESRDAGVREGEREAKGRGLNCGLGSSDAVSVCRVLFCWGFQFPGQLGVLIAECSGHPKG